MSIHCITNDIRFYSAIYFFKLRPVVFIMDKQKQVNLQTTMESFQNNCIHTRVYAGNGA